MRGRRLLLCSKRPFIFRHGSGGHKQGIVGVLSWPAHFLDTAMRRSRLVPPMLLVLALVSLPVAARTSPLAAANGDSGDTTEVPAVDADADQPQAAKPAAKRTGAPAAGKPRPGARGEESLQVRGPRWHRFLPGMFR